MGVEGRDPSQGLGPGHKLGTDLRAKAYGDWTGGQRQCQRRGSHN